MKIIKHSNYLQTTIYTKPTDKKLYLNFFSNHPTQTKKAIPFSQFLRLKRIVSEPSDLQTQVNKMSNAFKIRNYPDPILDSAIFKLSQVDRSVLFKYKDKTKKTDRPILILIYENKFEKKNILRKTLYRIWNEMMSENPEFHKYFNHKPMIAYKNGRNIKNTIISTKFPAPWHTNINPNQHGEPTSPCSSIT